MKVARWIQRSMPMAAVALVGAVPATSFAQQGQALFDWNGRVDREVQIVMRGSSVSTNRVGPTESGRMNARAMSALPRGNGQVVVRVMNGRGNVNVIQQPSVSNGFTTIVRVQDPRAGQDNYRVVAYWQGFNGQGRGVSGANGGNDTRGDVYRDRDDRDRDHDHARDEREREREREHAREEREREERAREQQANPANNGRYGDTANNGRYGTAANNGRYGAANQALHWSGNVDGELEIRVQNGRVEYRNISGHQPTNIRADAGNMNMPRGNANVSVVQNQGRGSVMVLQQPSSFNGYTTVLRVRDPQGGYGFYDFSLLWR